jgi:hypothetical protein
MKKERASALKALQFIIPLLEKYKFKWIITGGFATYVYGVNRPITDIDIDIDISKDDPAFKSFLKDIKSITTQKLIHFKNEFYDNYNVEAEVDGQRLDICPAQQLKVINKSSGKYELIYSLFGGFPEPCIVVFQSLQLPLLPKELIIQNKQMITRDKWDLRDIEELQKL